MAIDPKAAAAAAQAAAEAARAAAEAAAAAAAEAEQASASPSPTLAETTGERVLEETDAAGSGDGQLDGGTFASAFDRDTQLLGDAARDSLMALPGLDSAISGATQGGLTSPFDLASSFQSGRDPGFGTDAISSGSGKPADWQSPFEGWTAGTSPITGEDGLEYFVPKDAGYHVHVGNSGTVTIENWATGHATVVDGDTRTNYVVDKTGAYVATGTYEVQSNDNAPEWSSGVTADQVTKWVEGLFGADEVVIEEDDSSAGGSSGVSRPAPDEYGGYTGDWSGITPIGPGTGDDDLVAGATGNTGSSSGSGLQGPQGGDWAINPGSEGFVAGRETDLRDAQEWYGGGGDPGDPDLEMVGGNPAVLDQGIPTVDENTINPGSGEAGGSSDGEAQASTAYRAMPAMADQSSDETSEASLAGETSPTETMPVAEEGGLSDGTDMAADDDPMARPFGVEDDAADGLAPGRGHGYGRDGGAGGGRGRDGDEGRDHRGTRDDEVDPE